MAPAILCPQRSHVSLKYDKFWCRHEILTAIPTESQPVWVSAMGQRLFVLSLVWRAGRLPGALELSMAPPCSVSSACHWDCHVGAQLRGSSGWGLHTPSAAQGSPERLWAAAGPAWAFQIPWRATVTASQSGRFKRRQVLEARPARAP